MIDLTNLSENYYEELPKSLLSDKITLLNLCHLNEEELSVFRKALNCLERYITDNNIKIPDDILPLNLCFIENNEQVVFPLPSTSIARVGYHAIYRMDFIRANINNDTQWMTIFLEEMVHHFLFCKNERKAKQLVYQCLKYEFKSITIESVYRKEVLNE